MPQKRSGARDLICVYAHYVPGRLRLKLLSPCHGFAASDACRRLMTLPGALSATPNVVTGSIVLHYDSAVMSPGLVCAALEKLGFSPAPPTAADSPAESFMERLVGAAAGRLFEYVVERLALAAIEAAI